MTVVSNEMIKLNSENIVSRGEFNSEWKYMFVLEENGKPVCLLCGLCDYVAKKYSLV